MKIETKIRLDYQPFYLGNEQALTSEIMAGRVRRAIVNLRQSETRLHKSVRHKLHVLVATVFFDPACSSFTMLSS